MEWIVFLLATIPLSFGIQYDGLRVRVGWSDALEDKEYFFKVPRTIREVEDAGLQRSIRPPGPMPELRIYCFAGRTICPLYDTAGFVAGIQIALPVDNFELLPFKPEKHFQKWRAPGSDTDPAREYWTITQYFVSEESLKSGAGPTLENGATLQDGGVWVRGRDGHLLRVPATEAELNTTSFRKQNCIPNMGIHYYYKLSKHMKCEDLFPWFALTHKQQLIGVGFQTYGRLKRPQEGRKWLEIGTENEYNLIDVVMPDHPPCLLEWGSNYGIIALHIYYIDQPWNIRCRSGDSVKPAPVFHRLYITGAIYASKIVDTFKNMIG